MNSCEPECQSLLDDLLNAWDRPANFRRPIAQGGSHSRLPEHNPETSVEGLLRIPVRQEAPTQLDRVLLEQSRKTGPAPRVRLFEYEPWCVASGSRRQENLRARLWTRGIQEQRNGLLVSSFGLNLNHVKPVDPLGTKKPGTDANTAVFVCRQHLQFLRNAREFQDLMTIAKPYHGSGKPQLHLGTRTGQKDKLLAGLCCSGRADIEIAPIRTPSRNSHLKTLARNIARRRESHSGQVRDVSNRDRFLGRVLKHHRHRNPGAALQNADLIDPDLAGVEPDGMAHRRSLEIPRPWKGGPRIVDGIQEHDQEDGQADDTTTSPHRGEAPDPESVEPTMTRGVLHR